MTGWGHRGYPNTHTLYIIDYWFSHTVGSSLSSVRRILVSETGGFLRYKSVCSKGLTLRVTNRWEVFIKGT